MPRKYRSRTLFHLPLKLRVALAATMSPFERMKIIKKYIERPSNRTMMVMAEVSFLEKDCARRRQMLRQRKEASLKREEAARVPGSKEAGLLLDFYMRGTAPPAVELTAEVPELVVYPSGKKKGRGKPDASIGESEDTGIEGEFEV